MTSYIWTLYIQQSTTSKMVAISNLFSWARETMKPHGLMAVVYGIVVGLGVIGKYGAMEKWIIVSCNKSHCMTRPLVTGHLHVLDGIPELFCGLRLWYSSRLRTWTILPGYRCSNRELRRAPATELTSNLIVVTLCDYVAWESRNGAVSGWISATSHLYLGFSNSAKKCY
jgi:hypothetical protein